MNLVVLDLNLSFLPPVGERACLQAGGARMRQRSFCPAPGGLPACFVRHHALPRPLGCLFLPLNSHWESENSKTAGLKNEICNGFGLCVPFAGKHCQDHCFYNKKLQLWQKKKKIKPSVCLNLS